MPWGCSKAGRSLSENPGHVLTSLQIPNRTSFRLAWAWLWKFPTALENIQNNKWLHRELDGNGNSIKGSSHILNHSCRAWELLSLGPREKLFCCGPGGHTLGQELWASALCWGLAGRSALDPLTGIRQSASLPYRRAPAFPGDTWGLCGHCETSPQGVAVKLQMFSGIFSIKAKIDEFQGGKLWGTQEKRLRQGVVGGGYFLILAADFFFHFSLRFLLLVSLLSQDVIWIHQLNITCKLKGTLSSPVYKQDFRLARFLFPILLPLSPSFQVLTSQPTLSWRGNIRQPFHDQSRQAMPYENSRYRSYPLLQGALLFPHIFVLKNKFEILKTTPTVGDL